MLHYRVFHTDDSLAEQHPTFLLCTQESELEIAAAYSGAPDYALLQKHAGQWHASFYNCGRQFQFCGAGALAIAHYLLNKNPRAEATQTYTITADDFCFEILNFKQNVAVKLTADEPVQRAVNMPGFSECSFFTAAKLVAAPMPLKALRSFTADSNFCDMLVEKGLSALLFYEDLTKACIYFRYFTSFNRKFEDQITGSVFRYLPYLISSASADRTYGEYSVWQLSDTGAAMQVYIENQKVIYWGRAQTC